MQQTNPEAQKSRLGCGSHRLSFFARQISSPGQRLAQARFMYSYFVSGASLGGQMSMMSSTTNPHFTSRRSISEFGSWNSTESSSRTPDNLLPNSNTRSGP